MQRKSELSQSVTVEGNDLHDFMFPVNSLESKEILDKALDLGRQLKDILIFIALSMLLLIGISLLPESSVTVQEQVQEQQQYIYYQSSSNDWLH